MHRRSVVADLEATEDEGSGQGPETDELGREFLCPVPLVQELSEAQVGRTERGAQMCEACAVSNRQVSGGRQGLGWDALALGGVQFKASVIQATRDCEAGLCGLARAANGPVVKAEGRHVHWAIDGLGMSLSF